jgi:hypothetical protein
MVVVLKYGLVIDYIEQSSKKSEQKWYFTKRERDSDLRKFKRQAIVKAAYPLSR